MKGITSYLAAIQGYNNNQAFYSKYLGRLHETKENHAGSNHMDNPFPLFLSSNMYSFKPLAYIFFLLPLFIFFFDRSFACAF